MASLWDYGSVYDDYHIQELYIIYLNNIYLLLIHIGKGHLKNQLIVFDCHSQQDQCLYFTILLSWSDKEIILVNGKFLWNSVFYGFIFWGCEKNLIFTLTDRLLGALIPLLFKNMPPHKRSLSHT